MNTLKESSTLPEDYAEDSIYTLAQGMKESDKTFGLKSIVQKLIQSKGKVITNTECKTAYDKDYEIIKEEMICSDATHALHQVCKV